MNITKKDADVLVAAMLCPGWRPWRGVIGRARSLCRSGHLIECGLSAMPPHVVYAITPLGNEALDQFKQKQKNR
jgi:hypothetical protein